MKDELDPYYDASLGYSEQHIVHQPALMNLTIPHDAYPSDDPILNHERWSGAYRGHLIALPTGTISGVMALKIDRPSDASSADGYASLERLIKRYGWDLNTAFYEDGFRKVYLFECHNEVVLSGALKLADGIKMFGNDAHIFLPPYPCYMTNQMVGWGGGLAFTRDSLTQVPHTMMEYAVHIMNVTETFEYYVRDAA